MSEVASDGDRRRPLLRAAGALLLAIIVAGGNHALAQPPQPNVVAVEIKGNARVEEAKVLNLIKTRAGRPFNRDVIETDMRALNRSGLFVSVQPSTRPAQGGVVVTFDVVERPKLAYVKYLGNRRFKDKALAKQAVIKEGDPLSPYAVEEARRKIEEFYLERGFNGTRVTILEGNRATDPGAVFQISEGKAQKIRWTDFVGNSFVGDSVLKTQIQSKPGIGWLIKGYFDPKKLEEDCERLTAYYRANGFFLARVRREFKSTSGGDWVDVTFVVSEGPRYQIRSMSFDGNEKFASADLSKDLKTEIGSYFHQQTINEDVARIKDFYGTKGYILAQVTADPRFDERPGQLDLIFTIKEGHPHYINNVIVRIEGENPRTKRSVVLDRIAIRPGDLADTRKLLTSQLRLQRSQIFEIDQTKGIAPQLKFVEPETSDDPYLADRPADPRVRGQSPDPPIQPRPPRPAYWRSPLDEATYPHDPRYQQRPLPPIDRRRP